MITNDAEDYQFTGISTPIIWATNDSPDLRWHSARGEWPEKFVYADKVADPIKFNDDGTLILKDSAAQTSLAVATIASGVAMTLY